MAGLRLLQKCRPAFGRLDLVSHLLYVSAVQTTPASSRQLSSLLGWQGIFETARSYGRQSTTNARFFATLPPHTELAMPSLSPTMSHGNIAAWHVKEGDEVAAGDLLADIETDKATLGWENMDDGVVARLLMPAGSKDIPVGTVLAVMVEDKESVSAFKDYSPSSSPAGPTSVAPPMGADDTSTASTTAAASGAGEEHISDRVGPAVQRLLRQNRIALSAVHPTGPHGIVTKGDVLAALKGGAKPTELPKPPEQKAEATADARKTAASPPAPPPPTPTPAPPAPAAGRKSGAAAYTDHPNSQIRKIIASRLLESKTTVPHAYARGDVDLGPISMLRQSLKEQGVKVSVNDFIVKAVAMALVDVPAANAHWDEPAGGVVSSPSIDVSIAVATDKGLITPIVRNANQKTLIQISEEVRSLASKARANKLKPEEFQGGTFSISNLGMFGVDYFSAIINPPQACILAVGTTRQKVTLLNGQLASIPQLTVTLSCDARVVDGDVAGHFLQALGAHMHNAAALLVQH